MDPTTPVGARKTTIAAAVLLLMFLVSGTAAVLSGLALWRGEETDAVFAALPSGCEQVVLVDRPAELHAVLARLGAHPGVPGLVAAHTQAWLGAVQRTAAVPGVDTQHPWAVCKKGAAWYAAVPVSASAGQAGQQWLAALRSGPMPGLRDAADAHWQVGEGRSLLVDNRDRVAAALRMTPQVAQFAWRDTGLPTDATPLGDAATLLDLLGQDVRLRPLAKDTQVREAIERVGGGQLRLYWDAAVAQAAMDRAIPAAGPLAAWRQGIGHVQWLALAVRGDADAVRLQVQVGGGQRLASFLKEHLDLNADVDLSRWLPLAAEQRPALGIVRAPRRAWPMLSALDPDIVAVQELLPELTDRRGWQPLLAGPVVWLRRSACPLLIAPLMQGAHVPADVPAPRCPPGCDCAAKEISGAWVVGASRELQGAADWLDHPQASAAEASLDADLSRLLKDTQGWRNQPPGGPATQLDWVWLDTGLAGALTLFAAAH